MAEAVCDMWCEGCIYLPLHAAVYCDYLSVTGSRRPCPAGTGCTERVLRRDPPKPDARLRERERMRLDREAVEAAQKKARDAAQRKRADKLAEQAARDAAREEAREEALREKLAKMSHEMAAQRLALLMWRDRQHISQKRAAERCHVAESTWQAWEHGWWRANWTVLERVGCKRPS